jgi:predicted DNA-binding ribbon-helix-helix protein
MSDVRKYSVSINGHRTSVSLEPEFWAVFRRLCEEAGEPYAATLAAIDRDRDGNLSSAIRLWILDHLDRNRPGE